METEKCGFIGVDCEYIPLARKADAQAKEIEQLQKALREIYEVYAGSEGIPQPMTAAEGYLLFLLKKTAKIAQETLQEKE
jgi:hypothetical protein